MLKMSVSPLAIRNSNMPNSTPFKVEIRIRSGTSFSAARRRSSSLPFLAGEDRGVERRGPPQLGRSILQLVGSIVLAVSRRVMMRQPQPVFSSSNGSFSLRSPNEAIYIGWKNW